MFVIYFSRMKTQLDLMNIASSYKKPPENAQKKMDIKPVVNEILALKLVPLNVDTAKGRIEGLLKRTRFRTSLS